jgi:hypothetical protein
MHLIRSEEFTAYYLILLLSLVLVADFLVLDLDPLVLVADFLVLAFVAGAVLIL